ncbi:hypothetical protein BGZ72_002992 [Mortierella alpina]|nr:hypothetical protein BGZ72_002992 [Mortierella alpina]
MPETAFAINNSHSSLDKDSKVVPGPHDLPSTASTANLSAPGTESEPSADDPKKTTSIDSVTDSISKLSVSPSPPVSTPQAEPSTTENKKDSSSSSSEATSQKTAAVTKDPKEEEEELSPEEAKLRAKGLKSTHRPGFYIHIDSPRRLRIQTSTTTYDLDRVYYDRT